jgi:predicted TIM-barrel fold metal-dependent hydrolase
MSVATDVKIIDVDTHYSEPADLWTARVPAKFHDLVPHQVGSDEKGYAWLVNGDEVLSARAGAGSVVNKDGSKTALWDWDIQGGRRVGDVHPASHDPGARVAFMTDQGIFAQIIYPNIAGFGGHRLMKLPRDLSKLIVETYNDAMAEMQEVSNGRLYPQALVPFWDVELAVREIERAATELDLRGIVMCSEPYSAGFPDLVDAHWDPLWEACTAFGMPINLHVGASEFSMETFMNGAWPSLPYHRRHVVGSCLIELHNARVLSNLLTSDLLVRFPETKWVSVESGIGWIPYVIERLEYQLRDTTPDGRGFDQPFPSELFRRQVYACFWFEDVGPRKLLDDIGVDNVMFETDFPHPTCLYPSAREHALRVLEPWGEDVQRKVLQDNAAKLYRITV